MWRKPWFFILASLFSLGLLFVAYSNFFQNAFHFDDVHVIQENLYIRSLNNIPAFFSDPVTSSSLAANAAYRPLVMVTLAVDYWLEGGLTPFTYHVTQLGFLVVLGILLFFFYWYLIRVFEEAWWSRYLALFGALWFCLHTANSEVMNLIAQRGELLSVIGVLGSFVIYFYAPRWRRTYLYLIPMVIGAFAKVPAVMFAPLFFLYVWLIEEENFKTAFRKSLPAFILGIILFFTMQAMNHPDIHFSDFARMDYFRTQFFVWLRYIWLFFIPVGLSVDTDWAIIPRWSDHRVHFWDFFA